MKRDEDEMTKEIQDLYRINDRNIFNSYQVKQKEKINNNYIIKEDFKTSIQQWQRKKKIDNLIRKLENKM